jgi:hypothetical protein
MSKIEDALILCADKDDFQTFNKGITAFDEIIFNRKLPKSYRIKAIISLSSISSDLSVERIARIRDSIPFLENDEQDNEVELVTSLTQYPQINSLERLTCGLCLYNNDFLEKCYYIFAHLANDISVLIDYRVECIRYLMYSDIYEHVINAKEILINIIKTHEYPSSYRYAKLASFNSKTGLSCMLKTDKLAVEYDEPYLYKIQTIFFNDLKNGIRERLLSGQHLLTMTPESGISEQEKLEICNSIMAVATNYDGGDYDVENTETVPHEETPEEIQRERRLHIENMRADAADVLMRVGITEEIRNRADNIIKNLGMEKNKNMFMNKQKTAYNDSQNIHNSSINNSVMNFIDKIVEEEKKENKESGTIQFVDSYTTVHSEVSELIYNKLKSKDRIKAFKSLNRISIDTATFTSSKITTADVFVKIWGKIKKYKKADKDAFEELQKRTLDELVDMADTCSSGHVARLINIMSGGYGVEIKISWKDQLQANMAARMEKRMRDLSDEDRKISVIMGMEKDSEELDRKNYLQFITEESQKLREELYNEFVKSNHITEEEFNIYYEEAATKWVN